MTPLPVKETWTAKRTFLVASFTGRVVREGKLSYYIKLSNGCGTEDLFTPTEARLLIKQIEQHLKRIAKHKEEHHAHTRR